MQLPSDSAQLRRRTMTFFLAMRFEAIVKAIVSASGKPSGKAETAKAITVNKITSYGLCFKINKIATIIAIATTRTLICLENFSIRMVSGVFSSGALLILSAILPSSVSKPIFTTIASARPDTTVVPEKAILLWSVMAAWSCLIVLAIFSTGKLSPVRIDSFTIKFCIDTIRMSALILSPDSRKAISPIVRLSASTNTFWPSLKTLALAATNFESDSAVLLALFS